MMQTLIKSLVNIIRSNDPSCLRPLANILAKENTVWDKARREAFSGKKYLIATSLGCYEHACLLESLLSVALTLRGANVEILLCDKFLPCCQMTKYANVTPERLLTKRNTPRCAECVQHGKNTFGNLSLVIHWYSKFIEIEQAANAERISENTDSIDIKNFYYEGIVVGEHAYAGALRYYARADLHDEQQAQKILRRYFKAALLTLFVTRNLLRQNSYDAVVFHHGIYVPQGIIGEVCRQEKVRVINWNPSYRNQTFIFSHDDSYHHTMIDEPVEMWASMKWNRLRQAKIKSYLESRRQGTKDWIWFHDQPVEDINAIRRELNINFDQPCIGLLTSVMWDAQLHYQSNAFPNMTDWIHKTIDYFSRRPELQLIIRVHPAEIYGLVPSRQKMVDVIQKVYPKLPRNVFIVPPESHISTYALIEKCNAALIYNTKAGIEVACMGIPVIVSGEAWIRDKGFSLDASSPEEYFGLLDQLPLQDGLEQATVTRAQKYAFHFFFRRMIEIPLINNNYKHKLCLNLSTLSELRPGAYGGLDVICDGIMNGQPFIFESEEHEKS